MTASAVLVDVEDLAAIEETVVTADIDDVTWEMLRRAVPLESSLLLFVAGLVEAVVLLLLRGSHSTRASINKIKGLQSMRLNGSVFSRVKEIAGVVAVEGGR